MPHGRRFHRRPSSRGEPADRAYATRHTRHRHDPHRSAALSADAPEQVAFALDRGAGQGRYALHVLRLSNTITWQYRYDTGPGAYDPTPAQQLMNGTSTQLLAVQQAAAQSRP